MMVGKVSGKSNSRTLLGGKERETDSYSRILRGGEKSGWRFRQYNRRQSKKMSIDSESRTVDCVRK